MVKRGRIAWCVLLLCGCRAALPHLKQSAAVGTPNAVGQSWDVCTLIGPQHQRPGIYGTDLGITVAQPNSDQLAILFGDTWAAETDACAYPGVNADDLQASLPAQKPDPLNVGKPGSDAAQACDALQYPLSNPSDPTTWPRIHLYKDAMNRSSDNQLNTGALRTPVAAWSDGQHVFGVFIRNEAARCQSNSDCPTQMICSADPSYQGKHIGGCQPKIALQSDGDPSYCLNDDDCTSPEVCGDLDQGVCLAAEPFTVHRGDQSISPGWYVDDPRRAIALRLYLATALWPDAPEDYGTGAHFVTNKFIDPSARTVKAFDPDNPDNDDYSPGTDTLLMWGRPTFIATQGFQAFPFLLYQKLADLLDDQGNIHWAPHFFAGYDSDGKPKWSDAEADAVPIYGVDENLKDEGGKLSWDWKAPEFDNVEQMSVAWVAPLSRWVMLYGGDSPAFSAADPQTGKRPPPVHPQSSPGAIYLRAAAHPWGKKTQEAGASEAWSAAHPVLTRDAMASHLACGDSDKSKSDCSAQKSTHSPDDLLRTIAGWTTQLDPSNFAKLTAMCIGGDAALGVQNSLGGDSAGHLYGSNIIQEWTQDVTDQVHGLGKGERAAELYWNVSAWNPYEVVLVKTQLRLRDGALE